MAFKCLQSVKRRLVSSFEWSMQSWSLLQKWHSDHSLLAVLVPGAHAELQCCSACCLPAGNHPHYILVFFLDFLLWPLLWGQGWIPLTPTELWDQWGWKGPLNINQSNRPPTVSTAHQTLSLSIMPTLPLDTSTTVTPPLPGQPVPTHHYSFREEILPYIQPTQKLYKTDLKGILSGSVLVPLYCCLANAAPCQQASLCQR